MGTLIDRAPRTEPERQQVLIDQPPVGNISTSLDAFFRSGTPSNRSSGTMQIGYSTRSGAPIKSSRRRPAILGSPAMTAKFIARSLDQIMSPEAQELSLWCARVARAIQSESSTSLTVGTQLL